MDDVCLPNLTFNKDHVFISLEGQLTVDRLLSLSIEMIESPEFVKGIPQIWEASNTDISDFDPSQIGYAVQELTRIWRHLPLSKVAIVSDNMINHCSIALFKELYELGKGLVEIFDTVLEAEIWVKSSL